MTERVSSELASTDFLTLLDRVRKEGSRFVILHEGEGVAVLGPITARRATTFRELVELIRSMGPLDEEFVRDLEEIHRNQPRIRGGE